MFESNTTCSLAKCWGYGMGSYDRPSPPPDIHVASLQIHMYSSQPTNGWFPTYQYTELWGLLLSCGNSLNGRCNFEVAVATSVFQWTGLLRLRGNFSLRLLHHFGVSLFTRFAYAAPQLWRFCLGIMRRHRTWHAGRLRDFLLSHIRGPIGRSIQRACRLQLLFGKLIGWSCCYYLTIAHNQNSICFWCKLRLMAHQNASLLGKIPLGSQAILDQVSCHMRIYSW